MMSGSLTALQIQRDRHLMAAASCSDVASVSISLSTVRLSLFPSDDESPPAPPPWCREWQRMAFDIRLRDPRRRNWVKPCS